MDARLEQPGWSTPSFKLTSDWKPAQRHEAPKATLRGKTAQSWPVRQIETLETVSIKELSPFVSIYDFGQNASVYPEIVVKGPAGSSVKMTPSELLRPDGDIHDVMTWRLAYYTYFLSGEERETWRPQFFYRGSRYLRVERVPATPGGPLPVVESIRCHVMHADAPAVGTFSCSNELFNQIYELIRWAQRSNLMSVITDCPHREKLGWLEQFHLNGPSLRYNFNLGPLFTKTLQDMLDAQTPEGLVPDIAPEYTVFSGGFRDSPEWGSSILHVPWQTYLFDGDHGGLEKAYDAMKRYQGYLVSKSKDWILNHGLGDWYDIGPKFPGPSQLTPIAVTATAYLFENARILARTAQLLGRAEDEKTYGEMADKIREVFIAKFFNPETNQVATGSQCANAIALVFGLVPEEHRDAVVENLVKDTREKNVTAGDVGHVYLLRALADAGRSDVIYEINNQSDKPGYGMQIKNGATSLAETWDANPKFVAQPFHAWTYQWVVLS
jgi:alpha-L-rhamnosidase